MNGPAPTPERLGRYEIVRTIGRGAMAVVYEGLDPSLQRPVAIKVIDRRQMGDPQAAQRFLREAHSVARLNHPHIVAVYDVGEAGDLAYMVMELIRGRTLRELQAPGQPMPLDDTRRIADELLGALAYAHDAGIIHRDLKPDNVMLDGEGRVKLADFGVARIEGAADRTMAGTLIGTPRYMAPEQLSGGDISVRTDVFGAAALVYRMCTGHDAFGGPTLEQVLRAVMLENPQPPSLRSAGAAPPGLDAVLQRALDKDPAKRYVDARTFAAALRAALAGAGSQPSPVADMPATASAAPSLAAAPAAPSADPFEGLDAMFGLNEGGGAHADPDAAALVGSGTMVAPPSPDVQRVLGSLKSTPPDGTLYLSPRSGPATPPAQAGGVAAVQLVVTASADPRRVGQVAVIDQADFVLGRDQACDLVVSDMQCTRRHAAVRSAGGGYVVVDLGSSNGTWLEGRRLQPNRPAALEPGSVIRIGETTFTFRHVHDTTLPDLSGQVLAGRYRIESVLRASPKATVYTARVGDVGPMVAFKLLSPELAAYPGYAERFRRAAEAAAKLQHPHICQLLDHGMADVPVAGRIVSTPYLCHTLLAGGSLARRMSELAAVETALITRWLGQMASALAHAHRRGVVHGDLKPTSIAFDDEDNAYLMDFSVAVGAAAGEQPLLGAPAYMAPELWRGESPGEASDQFALAALAYALLTGTRPFVGQEEPKVRERNFRRQPPPVHDEARLGGRDDVPRAASAVLQRALAMDAADRFASVAEFARAIDSALRRTGVHSGEPSVFVSYQHEASAGWAVLLARELKERHRIKAFVDTQRLDAAVQFPAKLAQAIERCGVFVCLLAQGTLASRWVREEIRLAHEFGKPMIPVFQESFTAPERGSLDAALESLLQYDGVHLLDRRNIHVDHTIADLARLVHGTLREESE